MKIECPECGQHYEVDSSMIARHFCCTECKTLFLGLNAKPVKNTKFVPKGEGGEGGENADSNSSEKAQEVVILNAVSDNVAAEGSGEPVVQAVAVAAVPADAAKSESAASAPVENSGAADSSEAAEKPIVKITRQDNSLDIPMLGSAVLVNRLLAVVTGILVLSALIWLGVQSSKLNKLQKENASLQKAKDDLSGKVEALSALNSKVIRNTEAVDDLRDKYNKMHDDASKKFEELAGKIKELEEKNVRQKEEIEKLTAGIDELNEKIAEKNSKGSSKRKSSR